MTGGWLQGGGGGKRVDVHEVVGTTAMKGLLEMVEAGALVSLGTTSDGGALGITVTVNGEWRREYVRSIDEMAAYLGEAVPAVTDILAGSRPSAAPPNRSRRSRTR